MNPWLDISQRLNENTPYWPGDTQYSYRLISSMAEGVICQCRGNPDEYTFRNSY